MNTKTAGQIARRIFLWAMIVSFCLAAGAGILVLLGLSFDETGGQVLITTVSVGLHSLAMLCCGAVFMRPARLVGIIGTAVCVLSLGWSVAMIWAGWSEWEPVQVLLSGITFTVAFSFVSLLLASTTHRDTLIQRLLWCALVLVGIGALLTLSLIWDLWWESEAFGRFYGIILILAVLAGVLAPLLSALRRRTAPEPTRETPVTGPADHGPSHGATLSPEVAAALEEEAGVRGLTVDQLVAPLLKGPR